MKGNLVMLSSLRETRKALTDVLAHNPGLFYPDLGDGKRQNGVDYGPWRDGEKALAEIMVTPASQLIGRTLSQIGFRYHTHCIVMAIKRRSHMVRGRMTDIYLRAGDKLLVMGQKDDIMALKASRDVILVGFSVNRRGPIYRSWNGRCDERCLACGDVIDLFSCRCRAFKCH
jgi:hypothetical protein